MEKIFCRINYQSNRTKPFPKCKILINDKKIHDFVADKTHEEFVFEIPEGPFRFTIEHYDKNMKHETEKFIEILKIYFNDIDIKSMIWNTTQIAELPNWQKKEDFEWKSNLYLGHNATISYNLKSPIIKFLLDYHQPEIKTSSGMTSNNSKFLKEMKNYFIKIVEEQEADVSK